MKPKFKKGDRVVAIYDLEVCVIDHVFAGHPFKVPLYGVRNAFLPLTEDELVSYNDLTELEKAVLEVE